MEPVHLYELKKVDKFKIANWKTGEPEQNIYHNNIAKTQERGKYDKGKAKSRTL